jgi:hypothetical protein
MPAKTYKMEDLLKVKETTAVASEVVKRIGQSEDGTRSKFGEDYDVVRSVMKHCLHDLAILASDSRVDFTLRKKTCLLLRISRLSTVTTATNISTTYCYPITSNLLTACIY